MAYSISAEDVLRDIEFELIQATIRQDELGEGIQNVRKFHNELRTELLTSVGTSPESREIVTRQTQFNDMVMVLLQEMGNELLQLRQQQRGLNQWTNRHTPAEPRVPQNDSERMRDKTDNAPAVESNWSLPPLDLPKRTPGVPLASEADIRAAMRRDALSVSLDARPVGIPVLGWMLYKIRMALHNLAFFYSQRLAERQTEINRLYGEQLLALMRSNEEYRRQLAAPQSDRPQQR